MTELTMDSVVSPARSLLEIEADILAQKRTIGRSIVIIGQALREAKSQLEHGAWGEWLSEKVNFSQGTAENYMRIAEQVDGDSALLNLPYTKILALLSVPQEEREAFAEENRVDEKSVSEIKRLVRERDEAEKKADYVLDALKRSEERECVAMRKIDQYKQRERESIAEQAKLNHLLSQERERVAALEAREPDTVTIEREVPPPDYEATRQENARLNQALASTQAQLEEMQDRYGDGHDPLDVVPFCDACAALLNALYAAPYAKAYFETRSDAELERYSDNIDLILKWATDAQKVVDGIRADRMPDDQCFSIAL